MGVEPEPLSQSPVGLECTPAGPVALHPLPRLPTRLTVISWEDARFTGKAVASNLEIIQAGLRKARAVVVIMSGDYLAHLRDDLNHKQETLEREVSPQSRQNVLIEAGMAMAIYPGRTLLISTGTLRRVTDFEGLNYLEYSDSDAFRDALEARLKESGCAVGSRQEQIAGAKR